MPEGRAAGLDFGAPAPLTDFSPLTISSLALSPPGAPLPVLPARWQCRLPPVPPAPSPVCPFRAARPPAPRGAAAGAPGTAHAPGRGARCAVAGRAGGGGGAEGAIGGPLTGQLSGVSRLAAAPPFPLSQAPSAGPLSALPGAGAAAGGWRPRSRRCAARGRRAVLWAAGGAPRLASARRLACQLGSRGGPGSLSPSPLTG